MMQSLAGAGFEAARRYATQQAHHGHSFMVNVRGASAADDLQAALREICAPWQHQDLSAFWPMPDDATLAHAVFDGLQQRLGVAHAVMLRSAPDCGVELNADGTLVHWLSDEFCAAHYLPNVPQGHQCGRLHGHTFKVRLLAGMSLAELRQAWQPLREQLHNAYLNDIDGLHNPTSETLTEWLWQRLPQLHAVEVFETRTAGSRRDASGWTIWKEQCFEAAQPLIEHGRYTGHSYLARLFLSGTPDAQAGWIRDFADVKAIFKPFYRQLDHFALDEIRDLSHYQCADVADWLATHLAPQLPELSAIEVLQDQRNGARWSAI
ncbi:MAG: 6-pyruvoyl trahydropterin synthase family protein [Formosimonas sp.]